MFWTLLQKRVLDAFTQDVLGTFTKVLKCRYDSSGCVTAITKANHLFRALGDGSFTLHESTLV